MQGKGRGTTRIGEGEEEKEGGGSGGAGGSSGRNASGVGAEGTGGGTLSTSEGTSGVADRKPAKRRLTVEAGDGLEFKSADGEFKMAFHDLTQAELRTFSPSNDSPLHTNFFVPRQRWYFVGQVSRDVEFYTSINRGYGSLDQLDAFITLNFLETFRNDSDAQSSGTGAQGTGGRTAVDKGNAPSRKLRIRAGRFKTPYLYEYFEIAEGDLIAPERSLYAGNLAGNRQIGMMALGELFEERVNYAAGVFNGPRNSFQDLNSDKDVYTYLNVRPFLRDDIPALKYLNLGGSFNLGYETGGGLQPAYFATANDQAASTVAQSLSPTFLQFNNNVVENGQRDQWSGHAVYYYKSLGLLAEYGGGFQNYSRGNTTTGRVQIPFDGYMLQGFYFLTGEQITRRVNVVRPLKDFGFHNGEFGLGAIEVHARYSTLHLDKEIFTAGLADQNQWTNNAYIIDVGSNWYLNFYTKMYFDYQYAGFGNPVDLGNGHYHGETNLFWLRFQVYF